jgi:hypothetical protein
LFSESEQLLRETIVILTEPKIKKEYACPLGVRFLLRGVQAPTLGPDLVNTSVGKWYSEGNMKPLSAAQGKRFICAFRHQPATGDDSHHGGRHQGELQWPIKRLED